MVVNAVLAVRRRTWSRVRLFGDLPDFAAAPGASVEDRTVLRAALARVPRVAPRPEPDVVQGRVCLRARPALIEAWSMRLL